LIYAVVLIFDSLMGIPVAHTHITDCIGMEEFRDRPTEGYELIPQGPIVLSDLAGLLWYISGFQTPERRSMCPRYNQECHDGRWSGGIHT